MLMVRKSKVISESKPGFISKPLTIHIKCFTFSVLFVVKVFNAEQPASLEGWTRVQNQLFCPARSHGAQ